LFGFYHFLFIFYFLSVLSSMVRKNEQKLGFVRFSCRTNKNLGLFVFHREIFFRFLFIFPLDPCFYTVSGKSLRILALVNNASSVQPSNRFLFIVRSLIRKFKIMLEIKNTSIVVSLLRESKIIFNIIIYSSLLS
jgi:hypothetical protein